MTIEPNPHEKRIAEIREHSRSLNSMPGDLVKLSQDMVVAEYRDGKPGEPYDKMISRYRSVSTPYSEFLVLSCGHKFHDCIDSIISRGFTIPHPCYQFPCPIDALASVKS